MKPLLEALDAQRRHVLNILEGLDVSDLRRPVLPSGWHCLGPVNHLAIEVEHFWFGCVIAGEPYADQPSVWDPADPGTEILDRYRAEIAAADLILASVSLSDPPRWWPGYFGDFRLDTVEEILLHVITETACHAGHLDATRELLDGRQHFVHPRRS